MKTLILVLISALLFSSCHKDIVIQSEHIDPEVDSLRKVWAKSFRVPDEDDTSTTARRNRDLFYHTCASGYEEHSTGSIGLAASANVMKLSLQGANIKSWWIGAYWYQIIDGRRWKFWVQWGYAVDRGGLFQAFYVYAISPVWGQKVVTVINLDNTVPLSYGTRVRFEIINIPGTTYWSFLRNSQKVFDADLETMQFDGRLQSCTESWGSNSFSSIVHVDYLDMYRNGTWSNLPSGNITSLSWRLEGRVQRPEYRQSEHEFGGKYQEPVSYLLW